MTQTLYAHLDDANRVTEPPVSLSGDPSEYYGEELGARFRECPPETRQGSVYDPASKTWTHPAPPVPAEPPSSDPVPQYTTMVSVPRFVAQFGLAAATKISKARAYVPPDPNANDPKADLKYALDYLFTLLGYLNTERKDVDVSDPQVVGSLDFLASTGFITQDQASEIKRGVLVSSVV